MKWLLTLSVMLLAAGCADETLETGYCPHKLTDSPDARRAYYAPAYSPEATAAHHDDGMDMSMGKEMHTR